MSNNLKLILKSKFNNKHSEIYKIVSYESNPLKQHLTEFLSDSI